MAVAISQTGTKSVGGSNVATFNYTFTVVSGDTALIAFLAMGTGTVITGNPTAVWDSAGANQSMTLISSKTGGTAGSVGDIFIFGLRNPTAGASKIITFTWTGTNVPTACAITVTGNDVTSDANAFKNATSGTATTLAVTSAVGDMAICALACSGSLTALNQTVIFNDTTSTGADSAASRAAGAASVTFTATGTTGTLSMAGIDIAAAATTFTWLDMVEDGSTMPKAHNLREAIRHD